MRHIKKWILLLATVFALSGVWCVCDREERLVQAQNGILILETEKEILPEYEKNGTDPPVSEESTESPDMTEELTEAPIMTETPPEMPETGVPVEPPVMTEPPMTELPVQPDTQETELPQDTEALTEVQTETISDIEPETEGMMESDTDEFLPETETEESFTEEWTEEFCTCGQMEEKAALHQWDCAVFTENLQKDCDCGDGSENLLQHAYECRAVLEALAVRCTEECGAFSAPACFHSTCPALVELMRYRCTCSSAEADFSRHAHGCAYFQYMQDCIEFYNSQIDLLLEYNLPASGSSVTASGSGFQKAPQVITSSDFWPVKFYPGISSLERFTSANVAVGKTDRGRIYLYPKNAKAKGTFGARYRKVLHYNNQWYDMKMTVQDYSEKTYVHGGGTVASRPFIVFYEDRIGWGFNERMGELILKIEFVKTGTDTPAPVNARFQWWDIDSAQRFGIRLTNGSFAARYYSASGSSVNYQSGKVAGDGNNYQIYVAQGAGLDDSNPKGHLTFEIAKCSTYYMAFAYQDHLKDSDDYRNYKSSIEKWNAKLATGGTFGGEDGENIGELVQTDTSLSVIDTPAPKKYVSNTTADWKTANTLPDKTAEYYYMMEQFVPWNDMSHRYKTFQIKDTLPAGADYAGIVSVVRAEDNVAVTDKFQIRTEKDVITLTAVDAFKNSAAYYGYHYRILIKVVMDPTELTPKEEDGALSYQITNKAVLTYENVGASSALKESNTVETRAVAERSVRLHVTKTNAQTKEVISNAEFRVYEWDGNGYFKDRGLMKWDAQKKEYRMEQLTRNSVNSGKYKVTETKVPPGHVGFWEQEFLVPETDGVVDINYHVENEMSRGKITIRKKDENGGMLSGAVFEIAAKENIVSPQGKVLAEAGTVLETLTTDNTGTVVSKELYPGKYLVTEKKAPNGYMQEKEPKEIEIKWKDANTPVIHVELEFMNELLWANLTLTKEIDAEDIVWSHGNPTFTFCLQGEDIFGERHIYYETVEFSKENCPASGKVRQTAVFRVPIGNYTASEEQTIRYALQEIHSVSGGSVSNGRVTFTVADEKDRGAVFYNRKVTDQDESHTAFVRNQIGDTE